MGQAYARLYLVILCLNKNFTLAKVAVGQSKSSSRDIEEAGTFHNV